MFRVPDCKTMECQCQTCDLIISYWRAMVNMDPYMLEVYPEPPLTAYKRQKNIKDYIIRSKVPHPSQRLKRIMKGMTKCNTPVELSLY